MSEVAERQLGGAEVRCWPHHFDVAALLPLDPDGDPEQARAVGVGFSPGDRSYAEPYFYVSPWPYPDAGELPRLPEGARWHTEGWVGLVLTAERIISVPADDQRRTIRQALVEGVATCRTLLGR